MLNVEGVFPLQVFRTVYSLLSEAELTRECKALSLACYPTLCRYP